MSRPPPGGSAEGRTQGQAWRGSVARPVLPKEEKAGMCSFGQGLHCGNDSRDKIG